MTVQIELRGSDAQRFAHADLSDPSAWQLSRRVPGGVIYVPAAIERVPDAPADPLAAVRADAERWTKATGRPAGPFQGAL